MTVDLLRPSRQQEDGGAQIGDIHVFDYRFGFRENPGSRQNGAEGLLEADPLETAGSPVQSLHGLVCLDSVAERFGT